jgi:phosphoglucomutase
LPGAIVITLGQPARGWRVQIQPDKWRAADTEATQWIERRANELLRNRNAGVKQATFKAAFSAETTRQKDLVLPYVKDLRNVVDMDAIRAAGLTLAVDPLGGAAIRYRPIMVAVYKNTGG